MSIVTTGQGVARIHSMSTPCGKDCNNQPWAMRSYDSNGYPSSYTDFSGNVTQTTYVDGLLDQKIEAVGSPVQRTSNTTWNTVLRVPLTHSVLDASGAMVEKSVFVYNVNGQVTAYCQVDPAVSAAVGYNCGSSSKAPNGVRQSTYTYCNTVNSTQCPIAGLELTSTGPRTDVADTTTYIYYLIDSSTSRHGDLQSIIDPLGHKTTYLSYDGAGRILSQRDANGTSTAYTYTARGRLASRNVGGAVTKITYTPFRAVAAVTDPDGVVTTYGYDGAHRLTSITDAQGNSIQLTLDAGGNRTAENIYAFSSKTASYTLARQFNNLGQLTEVIDGLNHIVFNASANGNYDSNGNLVQSNDSLGVAQHQTYDALNRLLSKIQDYNGADKITPNTTISQTYDSGDRITKVTDPIGLQTSYIYDGLGNRVGLQSPDTGNSIDTFDAAGNRLVHKDARSIVSTSTYDALNRLTGTTYADTTLNVSYRYDESNTITGCNTSMPLGHLTRMIEKTVTTVYCYDSRGNPIQKQQITSGHTDTTYYSYTLANRLISETLPDHSTVAYSYDADGHISEVTATLVGGAETTVASNISWKPFGPISSYKLGSGQTITRMYDSDYRLTDIVSPGFMLHLARDAMGHVTAIGNAAGANPAEEIYQYDPLYRLSSVMESGINLESYTYNPAGDRLSKTSNGVETGAYFYAVGTHQILKIGSNSRANDANGNTTGSMTGSGGTYGFSYNGRNRESLAQLNGLTVGTYSYNAIGQRISKVAATTERYSYDEANNLVGEYGTTNRDYVWLGSLPIAVVDNVTNGGFTTSKLNYITDDQLNTPRVITNSAGTIIWTWAYKGNPFGERAPTSASGYVFNLRYPGQYFDAETGTNYNVFRNYEPAIGRYQESDPIGLNGGFNTFAYSSNMPLDGVDPYGLWSLAFQGYDGIGGGFSVTGEGFSFTSVSFRLGVGVGAGFAFNPYGGPPDESIKCEANSVGLFAEASAGIGAVSVGGGINAGVSQQVAAGSFNDYGGAEPSLTAGNSSGGLGIQSGGIEGEAEASAGIEFTHHF